MLPRLKGVFLDYWAFGFFFAFTALSVALACQQQRENDQRIKVAVASSAQQITDSIQHQLMLYQYGLRGVRGAIVASREGLTKEDFENYSQTRDITQEFPGATGFGFIQRVAESEIPLFLQQANKKGYPNFTIRQIVPHRGDRFIVLFVEPRKDNYKAIGLDIASQETRREAAVAAMLTGNVRLSGPITLVQTGGGHRQSFLILLPVYHNAETPKTEAERTKTLIGWSYAPLSTDRVLNAIHLSKDFHLKLTDITRPNAPVPFYQTEANQTSFSNKITGEMGIYGRKWQYEFSVSKKFISDLNLLRPLDIFLIGEALTLLMTLLIGGIRVLFRQRRVVSAEQARLAAIVENSYDGIISINNDGSIASWNLGAEKILGYTRDEVLGQSVTDIARCETQTETCDLMAQLKQGNVLSQYGVQRKHKNGADIDLTVSASPLHDKKGRMTGASVSFRDLTEMISMQRELVKLNTTLEEQVKTRTLELSTATNQLLTAAKVAELGIWTWELTTNQFELNDKMLELYDFPKEMNKSNVAASELLVRIYPDDVSLVRSAIQILRNGQNSILPIFRIKLSDGRIRYIQSAASMQYDERGQAVRITGINRDITTEREHEIELRNAKEKADQASKAKSMFVANMSHEIRTPMNAILGMLQLIQRTPLSVQQQDYVIKTQAAAKLLLNLLNDILDYSKVEAGRIELSIHEFSMEELFVDLSAILIGSQGSKNVEVMFSLAPDLPLFVEGDKLRLQQILINLASNAVKFTEEGNVTLSVTIQEHSDDYAHLRFSVCDTGIGINAEQQNLIFEGFRQADASITRRFGGTGLGLFISKQLVRAMGGDLMLESEPGRGSHFWFDIALRLPDRSARLSSLFVSSRQLNCLVVDDNQTSLDIMSNSLELIGWNVHKAISASDALALFSHRNRSPFDLIILDYVMPEMNGLDVAVHLKANTLPGETPSIIMVTAFKKDELLSAHLDSKELFDEFLLKPLTPGQIKATVENVIEKRLSKSSAAPLSGAEQKQSLLGLHILLVEDNEFNRQIAFELLVGEGATVDLAIDGQDAVDKVFQQTAHYDVVLMDMQMPRLDGLQATRKIRQHGDFHTLPIIAMTANVNQNDVQACLDAGMNGHLGKPLSIELIVKTILQQVKNENAPMVFSSSTVSSDIPSINEILARFGNNQKLYSSLLSQYRATAISLLGQLIHQVQADDRISVMMTLHTLKGTAGNMGLKDFTQQIIALEEALKSDQHSSAGHYLDETMFSRLHLLLNQNLEQIEQALQLLRHPVSDDAPSESSVFEKAQFIEQLHQLHHSLSEGNMRAIEQIQTLLPYIHHESVPQQYQSLLATAFKLADELDFEQSASIVASVIKTLEDNDASA